MEATSFAVPLIPAFNSEINAIVSASFAGYMDIPDPAVAGNSPGNPSSLFFWYFPGPVNSTDLVVFLNGGPGCLVGMFRGVGPIRYTAFGDFYANKDSWHRQAHIVFGESTKISAFTYDINAVDQPVGTGYSYNVKNTIPTSEVPIADTMYSFLRSFMKSFDLQNFNVVLAGESFAGQYIPYLLQKIVTQNTLALFSTNSGAAELDMISKACSSQIAIKSQTYIPVCSSIIDYVRAYVQKANPTYCYNEYDTRLTNKGICPGEVTYGDMKLLYILNNPSFRRAIHTDGPNAPEFFYPCSAAVLQTLSPDESPPSIGVLDQMLKLTHWLHGGISFHIISGKFDMIVNTLGIKWSLGNMTSLDSSAGELSVLQPWISLVSSEVFGVVAKVRNNLFFYEAEGSGHYVTYDQSGAASQFAVVTVDYVLV
ncbi:Cell death protease [Dinochytrium kinnereticum]|nr:Cell death protease [Dinochytrium kinnereticum]